MTAKAIQGTYADFKIIKSRNVAQFIVEVPLEYANEAVALFGLPDPTTEKWVAVAALRETAIIQDQSVNKAIQMAGMLCKDKRFGEYLRDEMGMESVNPESENSIADALRALLGIKSRTEMHSDQLAVEAFFRIKGEYDEWVMS
jgi:hypothetical protein